MMGAAVAQPVLDAAAAPAAAHEIAAAAPLTAPVKGKRNLPGFLLMAFGMFMALLDTQILGSSIREIQAGLSATPEEVSLIQTSYLIAEVIMIPMAGWFSRILSTRWLFTLSCGGFTLASLGCAMAWDINSMIVFRALQGFLGGAMIPTAFASGFIMFPGAKNEAKLAAVLGLMATLAPVLGPTFGGLITDSLSWRWLFFVNIVPGIIVTVLVSYLVRIDRPDWTLLRRFDYAGALFLALFLGGLQYVLDEGPRLGWFEDALLFALAGMALVAAVLFMLRSFSCSQPIVNLRAFKNRNFAVGCLLSFIVGIGLYGSIYLTPVFLGVVRHFNALQIGATVFVTGLFQVLATFMSIALRKRMSNKGMLMLGFATFMASCVMFRHITAEWGFSELLIPQALRGMGTMLCVIPLTTVALGALNEQELKGASGIYNLMRNLGGAIGLALINTNLFYNRLGLHYRHLADRMADASSTAQGEIDKLAALLGAHIVDADRAGLVSLKLAAEMVKREALVLSFADVYLQMAGAFLFGLLLVALVRPPAPAAASASHARLEH